MQKYKCIDSKIINWQGPFAAEKEIKSKQLEEIKTHIKRSSLIFVV